MQTQKEIKKQIKDILSKKELTRSDARFLMIHLFDDSYYKLGLAINVMPSFLKDQISAIKIFTAETQKLILKESIKITKKTKGN